MNKVFSFYPGSASWIRFLQFPIYCNQVLDPSHCFRLRTRISNDQFKKAKNRKKAEIIPTAMVSKRIRIKGLMAKIVKIDNNFPWASMKNVKITGEESSPQKGTSGTLNKTFLHFFHFLSGSPAGRLNPPDPPCQKQCGSMPIRIRSTGYGSGTPRPHHLDLTAHLCRRYAVFLSNVLDDSLVQGRHILPKKKHNKLITQYFVPFYYASPDRHPFERITSL
jgi:hypothetical protein